MQSTGAGGWSPFFGGRGEHAGAEVARRHARRARAAENRYAVQLRAIANQIDLIVNGLYDPLSPEEIQAEQTRQIESMLEQYARLIAPWAGTTAARMLADVSRRDAAGWHKLGQEINRALIIEVARAPIGAELHRLMDEQVHLITSLPREASLRVHELARQAFYAGRRWSEVAGDILATGEVTRSRANLIARTETGRAATTLLKVRAEHVGSEGFIWRTARDRDVRPLHRELEGQFFPWNDPPVLDDGRPGLPGTIWNCRCFAEPVVPGETPQLGPRPRNPEYLAALRAQGYSTGTAFE